MILCLQCGTYFVNPGVIFMTFSVDNLPFFSVGDDDQDKFPSFDQNVTSTSAGPSKSEYCSSSVVARFSACSVIFSSSNISCNASSL